MSSFTQSDCHVRTLRALGCDRGADGRHDARQPAGRGSRRYRHQRGNPAGAGRCKTQAGAGATESKGETVEQRITELHAALKITPDQEAKWNEVAQDMRENAAAMDKLVAETRKTPPQNMTAVDDLKMYQKFAQAHVDGLKNLLSHFEAFYAAMPDAQKKIADEVFRSTKS